MRRRSSQLIGAAWIAQVGGSADVPLSKVVGPHAEEAHGPGWRVAWQTGLDAPVRFERTTVRVEMTLGDPSRSGTRVVIREAASGPSLAVSVDPFGLQGAYAAESGQAHWCGATPQLVARVAGLGSRLDPEAVHGYLCFSYVPTPRTPFAGVRSLPAGATLTTDRESSAVRLSPEWRERPERISEDEAATVLKRLLLDSVRRSLGDAGEAAVFLSGGLDSSLIAAMLVSVGVRVRLLTLDFGVPFNLEVEHAEEVAHHLGLPLRRVAAGPREIRSVLDATAAALHQPFGDGVTAPLYLLGRAASETYDLVFNGEGGDQLFGGWANKPILASELYGDVGEDREAAYLATFHRFLGETEALYTPAARKLVGPQDEGRWIRDALRGPGSGSLLHLLRAANLRLKGAQNIAPRCVQLAAAHGLRVAAPLFDPALTEWTFSLPPELLLSGATEKHLLKRVASEYLPERIVWREKRGMGVPLTDWLEGPLSGEVRRRLSPWRLKRDGWFDAGYVHRLRSRREPRNDLRRRRTGEKLWALLMLRTWLDAQDPPLRFPK